MEARSSRAVAAHVPGARVVELGGGVSVFARVGSPINKVIGVGFEGAVDLAAAEATWGEPMRIELSTLAAPEMAASLTGFQLAGFENVLVRALGDEPAPKLEVVEGDPAWFDIIVDGFAAGDGTGAQVDHYARDAIEQVMRDFAAAQGYRRYIVKLDGEPAGAASMRIDDGIAALAGAATLPKFRRRGVQGALLAARLRDARAEGCELAVIVTAPGSLSMKNAMRSGFALAYARAVLQRAERV